MSAARTLDLSGKLLQRFVSPLRFKIGPVGNGASLYSGTIHSGPSKHGLSVAMRATDAATCQDDIHGFDHVLGATYQGVDHCLNEPAWSADDRKDRSADPRLNQA